MSHLFVNCRKLPFASTLGVAHFVLQLCKELARDHSITFLVADVEEVQSSPAADPIRQMSADVMLFADAERARARGDLQGVELVPHHFQAPEFFPHSIAICHDLHVFDIPWKYGDRAAEMQESFRQNLRAASAVVTQFPRTYYDVEHVAGISLMNLFLTESPLLFDTRPAVAARPSSRLPGPFRILYPAQLQEHKNHVALIHGLVSLGADAPDVRFVCPGSDFGAELSQSIHSQVADASLRDRFDFVGRVSDAELIDLYITSDAVMIPSLAEGGAYVALEAIAAELPVAVNRIRSAEMHLASMSARPLWFDASNAVSTGEAIKALVDGAGTDAVAANEITRERLERLSWSSLAEVWNRVIRSVEGAGPAPVLRIDPLAQNLTYA